MNLGSLLMNINYTVLLARTVFLLYYYYHLPTSVIISVKIKIGQK